MYSKVCSFVTERAVGILLLSCAQNYNTSLNLRSTFNNYFMHFLDVIEISLRLSFEKAGISFDFKISC